MQRVSSHYPLKNLNQFTENPRGSQTPQAGPSARIQTTCTIEESKNRVRERDGGCMCRESDRSQSSAAGCGTNASESARRSVRPSGCGPCVGTTIGAQTTNRRFSFTFAPPQPTLAPPPSPTPPTKNIVFSLTFLAETHGSYQGKINQTLSLAILTTDQFRRYRQQTARKSTGGGHAILRRLKFPYKEILTCHI
jgi:hypothetical protein